MTKKYINHIHLINRIVKGKTEGLAHEDSMKQLPFPGNCMNWNIGHILVYRAQYLGLLDGVSKPDDAEFAMYGAGSEPLTDSEAAIPLETLLQRLEESATQVISALETVSPDTLNKVIDEEKGTTVDDRLNFYLVFHESYHTGQLELLHELAMADK